MPPPIPNTRTTVLGSCDDTIEVQGDSWSATLRIPILEAAEARLLLFTDGTIIRVTWWEGLYKDEHLGRWLLERLVPGAANYAHQPGTLDDEAANYSDIVTLTGPIAGVVVISDIIIPTGDGQELEYPNWNTARNAVFVTATHPVLAANATLAAGELAQVLTATPVKVEVK